MKAITPVPTPNDPDAAAVADQAVALDMLLVDGALWPVMRMLPANAALRLALELARHPGTTIGRAKARMAEELGRIAIGSSELAPGPRGRAGSPTRRGAPTPCCVESCRPTSPPRQPGPTWWPRPTSTGATGNGSRLRVGQPGRRAWLRATTPCSTRWGRRAAAPAPGAAARSPAPDTWSAI